MENFKFWEPVKWGLKIFAPNYQKAHPYAKSGRTNRLAYCGSDVVLTLESDEKKKYARIAIGNLMSSITLRPLPRRCDRTAPSNSNVSMFEVHTPWDSVTTRASTSTPAPTMRCCSSSRRSREGNLYGTATTTTTGGAGLSVDTWRATALSRLRQNSTIVCPTSASADRTVASPCMWIGCTAATDSPTTAKSYISASRVSSH